MGNAGVRRPRMIPATTCRKLLPLGGSPPELPHQNRRFVAARRAPSSSPWMPADITSTLTAPRSDSAPTASRAQAARNLVLRESEHEFCSASELQCTLLLWRFP